MAQVKILVVEDEKNIVKIVSYNLEREGYRVAVARDGEEALEKIRKEPPDLILLDLMLPKKSGLELCRELRADRKTAHLPIVMLTAKGEEADRVVGLEMGADDYIPKPFSPRELVARVRAVLRRSSRPEMPEIWRCETLTVDWKRRIVRLGSKPVKLTPKEFELLKTFVESGGRVLSRDQLLEQVWGYDQSLEIQSRTVDIHVSQLRQKLGSEGKRLLTVTGAGYRWRSSDEESG